MTPRRRRRHLVAHVSAMTLTVEGSEQHAIVDHVLARTLGVYVDLLFIPYFHVVKAAYEPPTKVFATLFESLAVYQAFLQVPAPAIHDELCEGLALKASDFGFVDAQVAQLVNERIISGAGTPLHPWKLQDRRQLESLVATTRRNLR